MAFTTALRPFGLAGQTASAWGRFLDVTGSLVVAAALGWWVIAQATVPDDEAVRASSGASLRDLPRARETTLGFYGGVPNTLPSDVTIQKSDAHDFTLRDVQWEGKPFTNPIYYGVRTARWLTNRNGVMLDFTHSKAIALRGLQHTITGTLGGKPAPAQGTVDDLFGKLEASHGHNMLTLNGLMRLPSITARLSPYVGLGAGVSLPHMEVDIKGEPRTYEYQFAGPVGQALAGLELRLPRVSLFFEYKFTLAPYDVPLSGTTSTDFLPQDLWRQLQAWLGGGEPPGGRLSTTFVSHQLIGGLTLRVAPATP